MPVRMGAALYRVALRTYPPAFRREWGARMLDAFVRTSVRAWRRGGARQLVRWWGRTAGDLVRTVVVEWRDAWSGSHGSVTGQGGTMRTTTTWDRSWGVEGMAVEARLALRRYARRPAWTVAALTTLVVGVGAATGVVSLAHESLVRPLPFDRPDRLVEIRGIPVDGGEAHRLSLNLLETWEAERPGGIATAGWAQTSAPIDLGQGPEYIDAGYASGRLMELLGVRPIAGRVFAEADGREGAPPAVLLTEPLWRSQFGGDPGVVGQSLRMGSREYTVLGIVGEELSALLPEARLWMAASTFPRSPYITVYYAVGRLPAGMSTEVANDRLAAARVSDSAGRTFSGVAEPLRDVLVRDSKPVLLTFLALVAGLLLIGAVNLANLLLGRAMASEGDRTVRVALGASRARLVRGALVDGVMLGAAGGAGGLLTGLWVRRLVLASAPEPLPGMGAGGWGIEAVAAFGLSVALCAALAVWTASGVAAGSRTGALAAGAPNRAVSSARPLRRAQRALTVAQVGASFVLLVGAALLVATFVRLSSVDPGFEIRTVGGLTLSIPSGRYPDGEAQEAFARRLVEELDALPGVERVAAVDRAPLQALGRSPIHLEGADSAEAVGMSVLIDAQPGFFEVMGIPLLRGRGLEAAGPPGSPPVAVVTEAFARRIFPGTDAIGRRFRAGGGDWRTVVGVVGDVRAAGPTQELEPVFFQSIEQTAGWSSFVSVVFRAPGGAAPQLPAVRARLRALEPSAAVLDLGSYEQWLRASPGFAEARFRALIVGLLGAVALVLAVVGVYGVTAYAVRLRTRELGIRIALGSGERRTVGRVLGEGILLALAGVGLGAAVAWVAVERLSGFLAGAPARDPTVFAGVAVGLVAVVVGASLRPALTAARVAPAEVLREG